MHFFSTVQYSPILVDDSWSSYAEAAADVCRAPGRWVAAELWGGGKKHLITQVNVHEYDSSSSQEKVQGIKRVIRLIIGIVACLPGSLLAIPFMAFAYINEEIRLKHKFAIQNLKKISLIKIEESEQLKKLVEERQRLAKERQGCEPMSCILLSICCMLCILVCRQSK